MRSFFREYISDKLVQLVFLLCLVMVVFGIGRGHFIFANAFADQMIIFPGAYDLEEAENGSGWQGVENLFYQELPPEAGREEFNRYNSAFIIKGPDLPKILATGSEASAGFSPIDNNEGAAGESASSSEIFPKAGTATGSPQIIPSDFGSAATTNNIASGTEPYMLAPNPFKVLNNTQSGPQSGDNSSKEFLNLLPIDNQASSSREEAVGGAGEVSILESVFNKFFSIKNFLQPENLFRLARAESTGELAGTSSLKAVSAPLAESLIISDFSVPAKNFDSKFSSVNLRLSFSAISEMGGDYIEIAYSYLEEWEGLARYDLKEEISNSSAGGYFNLVLKGVDSWELINQLKIKISYVNEDGMDENKYVGVFLDSLWIEVNYLDSLEEFIDEEGNILGVEEIFKKESISRDFKLLSKELSFKVNEKPKFHFRYRKQKNIFSKIFSGLIRPFYDEYKDIKIEARLLTAEGVEFEIKPEIKYLKNGEFEVKFNALPRELAPGNYRLDMKITDDEGVYEVSQNFNWGVLALNYNKSVYKPNETAYLQMAVLSETGNTVCDADLTLIITDSYENTVELSTANGLIVSNPGCGPNNVILKPDYYTYYQLDSSGRYKLSLSAETNKGRREISDEIIVREELDYIIERVGPTRIYPLESYEMKIIVTVEESWRGEFIEKVPAGFSILESRINRQDLASGEFVPDIKEHKIKYESRETKLLIWPDIRLDSGDTIEFIYRFDAPDASPEFYLLGPAGLVDSSRQKHQGNYYSNVFNYRFIEARQWQIASDEVPSNLKADEQYLSDGVATISNGAWIGESDVVFGATAGLSGSSTANFFFELVENSGSFTTATSVPASYCNTGDAYSDCAAKIWRVATDTASYLNKSWLQTTNSDFNAGTKSTTTVENDSFHLSAPGTQCSGSPSACAGQSESSCNTSGCTWTYGDCDESGSTCASLGNQTDCNNCSGCSWVDQVAWQPDYCGDSAALDCSGYDSGTCGSTCTACTWNAANCSGTASACSTHTNSSDCTGSGCSWNNYNTSGYLVSQALDTGYTGPDYTSIVVSSSTPSGGSVTVEARASSTQGGLSSAVWYGNIASVPDLRWVQWRVSLSGDGSDTPTVTDVTVNYRVLAFSEKVSITLIPDNSSGYKWQVLACDDIGDCTAAWAKFNASTPNFKVDTIAPTAPGALTEEAKTGSTVILKFGGSTTETNFSEYKIFYKKASAGVTEGDSEHTDVNLGYIDYNGATTTRVIDLAPESTYVFNIWAYDQIGNKSSSTEVVITTLEGDLRGRTVQFLAGVYTGDGSTGQNSDTNQTFSTFNFHLAEDIAFIKNAFILFEAQFEAYANNAGDYTGYNLGFDSCQEPCTANAFSGSGRVLKDDNTVLAFDETESNQVRLLLDVSSEVQLAAYEGGGINLEGQVGYKIERGSAINSIAAAKAILFVTYKYEDNTDNYTNTVVYPLESAASGDKGSRRNLQTDDCVLDTDCPKFSYNAQISDLGIKQSQWFTTFNLNDGNAADDIEVNVNIEGTDIDSATYFHESVNGGEQSNLPAVLFNSVSGYSENTSQQLEYHAANIISGATYYLIGGEVTETYSASTSANTKTRTVSFPLGVVNNGLVTSETWQEVNVYFPENGSGSGVVDIKKAWLRVVSNTYDAGANTITVNTQVGDNGTSSSHIYNYNSGDTIVKPSFHIIHVIPSADYTQLESANANTSKRVRFLTLNSGAVQGGLSAELMITYTYTNESSGYLSSLREYGGQSAVAGNSQSATSTSGALLFPELTGSKTLLKGAMLASYLISSNAAGGVPAANLTLGTALSTTSPSCSNAYNSRPDAVNGFTEYYKDITSSLGLVNQQAYSTCFSNNGGSDADTGAKMNGIIIYTYQWDAPPSHITQNDWRWYDNIDATEPTNPKAGENTGVSQINLGDILRLRINAGVSGNIVGTSTQIFKLQYGEGSNCGAISAWKDVGTTTSAESWRGYNNTAPSDNASLASTVLASSTVAESYEEDNPSAGNVKSIPVGGQGEWDWTLYNYSATSSTDYCFRLVKSDDTALDSYNSDSYPKLTTAPANTKPNDPVNLDQLKNDGSTAINNGSWINENSVKLVAAATDPNISEIITLYFELIPATGTFRTVITPPASPCASSTAYTACSSKIWAASSTAGDYRSSAFLATSSIGSIPDDSYKWQVLACDDDSECSGWVQPSASPNFKVDITAPSPPGNLTLDSSTITIITIAFGSNTTENNFKEYKIFYKQGNAGVTESDTEHDDADLDYKNYNSTATTTINNLSAGTEYVFNIFVYDQAGNKASATIELVASTTESYTAPIGTIESAAQKTDGLGGVDILISADDADNDDTLRARVFYEAGSGCGFASLGDPFIDETDANTTANYGDPKVDNNSTQQVGTSTGWILTSPGENFIAFDWLSRNDIPGANGTYCIGLAVNDGQFNQTTTSTRLLIIDNVAPSTPGSLTLNSKKSISVTLNLGGASSDTRFNDYRVYYSTAIPVTVSDTEHDDPNFDYVDYNSAATTTVSGLTPGTTYYFNIWAYDTRGNHASATAAAVTTNNAPSRVLSDGQYKSDAVTVISNGAWTDENSVWLEASADDGDLNDLVSLYFEVIAATGSFSAATTVPSSCSSGTDYSSCSSKIWAISTTTSATSSGSWLQTSNSDFNAGTKSDVDVGSDSFYLSVPSARCIGTGTACGSLADGTCGTCGCTLNSAAACGTISGQTCGDCGTQTTCGNCNGCLWTDPGAWDPSYCANDPALDCSYYSASSTCTTCTQCEWTNQDCSGTVSACSTYSDQADCGGCGCSWIDYSQSGFLISQAKNTGYNLPIYTSITVSSSTPSGTTVSVELRSASTEGGLSSAAWYSRSNIASVPHLRWVQWRVSFTSTGYGTPTVNDVTLAFESSEYTYTEKVSITGLPDSSTGYKWQVLACDDDNDCTNTWTKFNVSTPNFKVDILAPTAPGALTENSKTSNSAVLNFGAATNESNFLEYRIYYSTSTPVAEADNLHGSSTDANLADINYGSASITTVNNLISNTTYYFNIWAYDQAGHKASSTAVAITTNQAISTPGALFYTKNTRVLFYRVWDGSDWGVEQSGPTLGSAAGDNIRHIRSLRSDDGGKIGLLIKTWDGVNQEWWGAVYRYAANDFVGTSTLGSAQGDAVNNNLITGCIGSLSGGEFIVVRNNGASDGTLAYSWNALDGWTAEGAGPNPIAVLNGCKLERRPGTDNYLLLTFDDDADVGTSYYYGGNTYGNSWTAWTQFSSDEDDIDNYVGEAFFDASDNTRGAINYSNSSTNNNTIVRYFSCNSTSISYGAASTSPTNWPNDFVHGEFAVDPGSTGQAYYAGRGINDELNVFRVDVSSGAPNWSAPANGDNISSSSLYAETNYSQKPFALAFYRNGYGVAGWNSLNNTQPLYRTITSATNALSASSTNVEGAAAENYTRVRFYDDPNEDEFIAVYQNNNVDYAAVFWDGAGDHFYNTAQNPGSNQAWTIMAAATGAADQDDECTSYAYTGYNSAPNEPTTLKQTRVDGLTAIVNGSWLNESEAQFTASFTDIDTSEIITFYLQLLANSDSFATSTAVPTNTCGAAAAFGSCNSKIWAIASSSANDYSVTPYTATGTITGIPDSSLGYKWQILSCDDDSSCSSWVKFNAVAPNFKIDTTPPTPPGALTVGAKTSNSVTLSFGAATTEDYFSHYKIYYKQAASGAAESDTEHSDNDLNFIDYNSTSNTVVTGLATNTQYVFNIWAYDLAGNKATASPEVATTTNLGPNLSQASYLWENDDGADVNNNSAATTTGTAIISIIKGERLNARIQIENSGDDTAGNIVYKLQFDTNNGGTWIDVANNSAISYSQGLSGDNGDNISSRKAALNPGKTWIFGSWHEAIGQTGSFSLGAGEFTEFVFAIKTNNAGLGNTYRLRLYDNTNNEPLKSYAEYAAITIRGTEARRYSKATAGSLSSNTSDLTYYFDPEGYNNILSDDAARDEITAASAIPVYNFAAKHTNNTDAITITWNGQSSAAPTSNNVVLQVYRYGSTNNWVTMDTESAAGADNDFNLSAGINSDLDEFYGLGNWTYWRVYQAFGSETLRSDYFSASFAVPVADTAQIHYRWRNDDGSEVAATWMEAEDTGSPTAGVTLNKGSSTRLRIAVSNVGGGSAANYTYQIEYASSSDGCVSDPTYWETVPVAAASEHFEMNISSNFTDGDPTTATTANAESYSFVAGDMVEDPSNTTGAVTLLEEEYTEIEYMLLVTSNASDGGTYCFRVTNSGTNLDSYDIYPVVTLSGNTNIAPVFSVYPTDNDLDGGSASTTPTNEGANITFQAVAGDVDGDDYYLAVCRTNSITPGVNGPPTCSGGSWCISAATASGTQASCDYTAATSSEENIWFAFACDKKSGLGIAKCSTMSQGASDSEHNSPFAVNHLPNFTGITTLNDGQDPGSTFIIQATSSETDTFGGSDTVSLYVCYTNAATFAGCNGGAPDTLCSTIATSTNNAMCLFGDTAPTPAGANTYYAFVFDSHNLAAASNSLNSVYTINNVAPSLGSLVLNGGSDIILNISPALTSVQTVNSNISDQNGCTDIDSATARIYMSNVAGGYNCSADNNDCYHVGTSGCALSGCSGASDTTAVYTCTAELKYYAIPTDAYSAANPYKDYNWLSYINVFDGVNYEFATSTGVEVETNIGLEVVENLINFGSGYSPGQNSGQNNATTTIINVGNSPINTNLKGTNMAGNPSGTLGVDNIKYSLKTNFEYISTGTPLSLIDAVKDIEAAKPTSTFTVADDLYWGIKIPLGSDASTYAGVNTFTVIIDNNDW